MRGDEPPRPFSVEGRPNESPERQPSAELARPEIWVDPDELELAQATFNETAVYEAIGSLAAGIGERARTSLHILDVCAATGLAAHHASTGVRVGSMTLVDMDAEALKLAKRRHDNRWPQLDMFCEDAVEFSGDRRYDLVVANSAYHHIEDERKLAFLRRVRDLLARDGRILVGENFLPEHGPGDEELRRALHAFYRPLFVELRKRGTSEQAIAVMEKALELALRREVEFKVSWDRFENDVSQAELRIEEVIHIWDPGLDRCGTKVVQLCSGPH